MPQVIHSLGSVSLTSSYTAQTAYGGSHSIQAGDPNTATHTFAAFTYAALGIPEGSAINSVLFRTESFGSPAHGTDDRLYVVNGSSAAGNYAAATDYDITGLMSAGSNTIALKFRSGTSSTTYPSAPSVSGPPATRENSGSLAFNDSKVIINYTLPFSACVPPSAASLSAAVSEGNVDLNFSGAAGGTNNAPTGQEVQFSESDDNASWGAWQALTVFATGSGSGALSVAPSSTRGRYRRFQLRTQGAAGADYYSGWAVVPGSVRRNSAPAAPGVTAPADWATTYNSQPRILATVGSDADGHTQTMAAAGYVPSSAGAQAAGKKLVLRRSSGYAAGGQVVSVSSTDAQGVASAGTARGLMYTVPAFTDATLVAGTTPIKAAHMAELRTMINNVRAYYGMAAYGFTALTAGATGLAGWSGHVQEMRTAIDQVVSLVNGWDTANGTNDISLPAWIAIPVNCPTTAVIAQLRAAIPLL